MIEFPINHAGKSINPYGKRFILAPTSPIHKNLPKVDL